jgi:hypothetical protein
MKFRRYHVDVVFHLLFFENPLRAIILSFQEFMLQKTEQTTENKTPLESAQVHGEG